jgi:tetratricopeptide (TPR) repeat protein
MEKHFSKNISWFKSQHFISVGRCLLLLILVIASLSHYAGAQTEQKRPNNAREDDLSRLDNLISVGIMAMQQHDYAQAEKFFLQARTLAEKEPDKRILTTVLSKLASIYEQTTRNAEAEDTYKKTIAIREEYFGPTDPRLATDLNNLAFLYFKQSRFVDAERVGKQALEIAQKAKGMVEADRAAILDVLGRVYSAEAKFKEAEPLLKHSVEIREKLLGPNSPQLGTSLNSLAVFYEDQHKYAEAESLLTRALGICDASVGPDDPETAKALNNLASVCMHERKYDTAEPYLERALKIIEKAKGSEHLECGQLLSNIGALYTLQHKYELAETTIKKAMSIKEKALGSEQRADISDMQNLAQVYKHQGKFDEAEDLLKRTVAAKEKLFGLEHPQTIAARHILEELQIETKGKYHGTENLLIERPASKPVDPKSSGGVLEDIRQADLFIAAYRWAEAEPIMRRALKNGEEIFSLDSPELAKIYLGMGVILTRSRRSSLGEPYYKRALDIVKKQKLENDPAVASIENSLADCYIQMSRSSEAVLLLKDALSIMEKLDGTNKSDLLLADILYHLSVAYREQGRFSLAMAPGRRSLEMLEKAPGKDKVGLANCLDNLASLYQEQHFYRDADVLYKRSVQILEAQFGPDNVKVGAALNNLAHNCLLDNKLEEAEALLKRALSIERNRPGQSDLGPGMINLGAVQKAENNLVAAEATLKQAIAYYEKEGRTQEHYFGAALAHLATTYYKEKKFKESKTFCQRSLSAFEKTGTINKQPGPEMQWLLKELQKNGY